MVAKIILLLLCLASVGYFLKIVAGRLGAMRTAKSKLKVDRVGERLWRTFKEVMLQTRVIRDRPIPGILHAMVMWGFFAFGLVSMEHFALGFMGLENAHRDESWYGWFAAGWAVAVTVGIVGLAFRRFVLRPKILGDKLSGGSAIVAGLIVVLMVTYLAGWRWLEIGSTAWTANWWAHTLGLLGMLWVIPSSKHLHLFLGPVGVFFREGETTSATRPLDEEDDDDFGMLHLSDMSQKDILDVNSCVECGRCTQFCPANIIGGTLNPKEVVLGMRRGLLSGGDLAETRIAGTAEQVAKGEAWVAEEDLFQCYTCGACEQACPVGIEHVGMKILDLRRGLVSEGRTNNDKLNDLFNTMERSPHNAWGASQDVRRKLVEGEKFPIFDGSQEYLLWMGCGLNYDPHGNDVARAMKKVLDASGTSWGVLKRETCCGEPARRAGNEYLYMELSEKVIEALEGSKAKTIITCDPHCCRTLDVDYRQNEQYAELGVRVMHHTEFLAEATPSLPLKPDAQTVAYHDPCYLSRGRGVVDQPRAALGAAGLSVAEMDHNRERSFCCGAGGAQLYIADDKVEYEGGHVNDRRFAEANATDAETIAVACPYCQIMLKDAAGRAKKPDVQILDVAELVASRLE